MPGDRLNPHIAEHNTEKESSLLERLEERLKGLKAEHEKGQKMLAAIDFQQGNVKGSLLRISGAIQVLEEELTKAGHSKTRDISERGRFETEEAA